VIRTNLEAASGFYSLCRKQYHLILEMAWREISDRYSGQAFGFIWAVVHPVFLMCVYFFIFGVVFKMRLGGTEDMPKDYATYLLSGLVMWLSFQDVLTKSCTAISSNSVLVKQFVFPIEVLPVKTVLASVLTQVVTLLVLIIYVLIKYGALPWTYFLLPLVIAVQMTAMVGIAYFLSAVGVYFRDAKDVVQLLALLNMYLMPIFYLPHMVPELFKPILYSNPFSAFVFVYQDILYFGRFEHPIAWVVMGMFSLLALLYGFRFFNKVKHMFGGAL